MTGGEDVFLSLEEGTFCIARPQLSQVAASRDIFLFVYFLGGFCLFVVVVGFCLFLFHFVFSFFKTVRSNVFPGS